MIKLTDELTMDLAVMFKAVPATALECEGKTVDVLTLAQSGVIVVRDGKPVTVPETLYKNLSEAYGVNTAGFNETFHKSFGTVANMTPEEYFFHQILHYFTTYGAESVGVNIPTYVPAEALELPEGMLPVNKLTVIQTLTEEELVKQMSQFAITTKAPNEAQKSAMQRFLPYVTVSTENMESFEFQVMAHDYRGTVPENPVSVLRYLIYKTTGGTLIIKSPRLIEAIRDEAETADDTAYEILKRANEIALAEVFLRYKPILLAYKQYPGCAPIINRIRRLAVRHHKPLSDEAFQNVIQLALAGRDDAVEPNGAAEAFWFEPEADDVYIMSVNEFSGPAKAKFEFVVTTQKPTESDIRGRNFTYDPEKIATAPVPLQFNDSSEPKT